VRDRPPCVDAVAAEASAELIEQTPLAHAPERRVDHRRFAPAQAKLEVGGMRKLGRAAKAAVARVEARAQHLERGVQRRAVERRVPGRRPRLQPRKGKLELLALLADRGALLFSREGMNIVRPLMLGGATSMYCGCSSAPASAGSSSSWPPSSPCRTSWIFRGSRPSPRQARVPARS